MDEAFIRNRITELRMKKNVSEYRMSLDLGHSKSYIQSISSGKSLPSLPEFLGICDYFRITPKEFFDRYEEEPILVCELVTEARKMKDNDIERLIDLARRLNGTR